MFIHLFMKIGSMIINFGMFSSFHAGINIDDYLKQQTLDNYNHRSALWLGGMVYLLGTLF